MSLGSCIDVEDTNKEQQNKKKTYQRAYGSNITFYFFYTNKRQSTSKILIPFSLIGQGKPSPFSRLAKTHHDHQTKTRHWLFLAKGRGFLAPPWNQQKTESSPTDTFRDTPDQYYTRWTHSVHTNLTFRPHPRPACPASSNHMQPEVEGGRDS